MCKREVTKEDAVKGDKRNEQADRERSDSMPWFFGKCRMHLVQMSKRVVTGRRHLKDCMTRSRHKNFSHLVIHEQQYLNQNPQHQQHEIREKVRLNPT